MNVSGETSQTTVNVKKTDLDCQVTTIEFYGETLTTFDSPLVCQLHQTCSFTLPPTRQTPACGHPDDVYLKNAPHELV